MSIQVVQIKIDPSSVKRNPRAGRPAPSWLYSYLPSVMGCDGCHTDFFHTELEDNMDEDYYGNMYGSCTVCPYCHEHVDCVLEFEKIDDFLKNLDKQVLEVLSNPVKLNKASEKVHKQFCDALDKTTQIPAEDWYIRFD